MATFKTAKPIQIITNCAVQVLYEDNYYFIAKTKGINTKYKTPRIEDLPSHLQAIITGKRGRLRLKRGCAARGWSNPIPHWEKKQKEHEQEQQRLARIEQQRITDEQRKAEALSAANELLRTGSQVPREKAIAYKWTITLVNPPGDPKNIVTRELLRAQIESVKAWHQIWTEFQKFPISSDMHVITRAYADESFTLHRDTWSVPRWLWDAEEYLQRAESRLQYLDDMV